jgi:hypothetical protein
MFAVLSNNACETDLLKTKTATRQIDGRRQVFAKSKPLANASGSTVIEGG